MGRAVLPHTVNSLVSAGMLAMLLAGVASASPSRAESDLECRTGLGAWQPCRINIASIGKQWQLQLGQRRIEIRHDGSGQMVLRDRQGAPWSPVETKWLSQRILCWGSVCARGNLPLD